MNYKEAIEQKRAESEFHAQHDQSTHGNRASNPNPKLDRWEPENPTQAIALKRLKAIPSEGKQNVDGETVKDAIKGSAPYDPSIREKYTDEYIESLPSTEQEIQTDSIIATKQLLKRSAIAAVIHALENPSGPWFRPGYLPIVIPTDKDKYFLWDGHHRIEGARILNQKTTKVRVVNPQDALRAHGQHDQKSHGSWATGQTQGPPFQGPNEQREYTPLSEEEEELGYASTKPIEYPPGYKEESEQWIASLTPEEQKAAADYTGSYLYGPINEKAIAGTPSESVDALDRALAKAPVRDTPIRVYRRASFKDLEGYMQSVNVGDTISLAKPGAFQSCSVTNRFPVATGGFHSVIYEINTRSGASIGNVTQGGGTQRELEVLLPRTARYRIVSIQRDVQFGPPPKTRGFGDDMKRHVIQVEEVIQ